MLEFCRDAQGAPRDRVLQVHVAVAAEIQRGWNQIEVAFGGVHGVG
jgi:hypothetical protein